MWAFSRYIIARIRIPVCSLVFVSSQANARPERPYFNRVNTKTPLERWAAGKKMRIRFKGLQR